MIFALLATLLFLLPPAMAGAEMPYAPTGEISFGGSISYLEDPRTAYSVERVTGDASLPWKASEAGAVNLGYKDAAYWIRLRLPENATEARFPFLCIDYPLLDDIRVFRKTGPDIDFVRTGDHVPFPERAYKTKNFVLDFENSMNMGGFLYLRVRTASAMTVPVILRTREGRSEYEKYDYSVNFMFLASLVVMLLFNLVLFVSIRDVNYLYYVLYILTYAIVNASLEGLAVQYLWGASPWFADRSIPLFLFLNSITVPLFAGHFLSVDLNSRAFSLLFRISAAFWSLMVLMTFLLPYPVLIRISNVGGQLNLVMVFAFGMVMLFRGYKPARFYMAGWFTLIVSIVVFGIKNLGYLPHTEFTRNFPKACAVLEAILLALALADRFVLLKEEKERVLRRLVENQRLALDTQTRLGEESERRLRITEIYTRRDIVETIAKGGDPTRRKPETRKLSMLVSDIRDFTDITENLGPVEIAEFLNSYFARMNTAILEADGEIDKLSGDCVTAFFPDPDDAVRAAIRMRREVVDFNRVNGHVGSSRVDNGIAMNSGEAVMANIGSIGKLDLTLVGGLVTATNRLGDLGKRYSAPVVMGGELKDALKGSYRVRFLDEVFVKGRIGSARIFEVYDYQPDDIVRLKEEIDPELRRIYGIYRQGRFEEAGEQYAELEKFVGPHRYSRNMCADPLIRFYRDRCTSLLALEQSGSLQHWSGVWASEPTR